MFQQILIALIVLFASTNAFAKGKVDPSEAAARRPLNKSEPGASDSASKKCELTITRTVGDKQVPFDEVYTVTVDRHNEAVVEFQLHATDCEDQSIQSIRGIVVPRNTQSFVVTLEFRGATGDYAQFSRYSYDVWRFNESGLVVDDSLPIPKLMNIQITVSPNYSDPEEKAGVRFFPQIVTKFIGRQSAVVDEKTLEMNARFEKLESDAKKTKEQIEALQRQLNDLQKRK